VRVGAYIDFFDAVVDADSNQAGFAGSNSRSQIIHMSWERVFRICRNYGLNHMRFHSFCPPEAAFIAADLVGFYLQPEGPSWPNHGPRLGNGQPIDKYLMDETIALTKDTEIMHLTVCWLVVNEPSGRWVAWVSKFVDYWKATDPRRVYTGASVRKQLAVATSQ